MVLEPNNSIEFKASDPITEAMNSFVPRCIMCGTVCWPNSTHFVSVFCTSNKETFIFLGVCSAYFLFDHQVYEASKLFPDLGELEVFDTFIFRSTKISEYCKALVFSDVMNS